MSLKYEDFAIMLALESDPFMPMTELAETLGVTRITAKKRVDDLKSRGIIKPSIAIYSNNALGLNRINIYAKVSTIENLTILEKACDEHPYTYYRVRAFGGGFGLFMQFNIPQKSNSLLLEFIDKLRKEGIIEEYDWLESNQFNVESYSDLSCFNSEFSCWEFSWEEWFKQLQKQKTTPPKIDNPKIDYSTFNPSHFKILRLLTADGSLKQTDIKETLNLSRTQAHREFNFVMDNYIEKIRFMYDREIFDLNETYLAIGTNVEKNFSNQLFNTIESNPPPFRLALDISNDNKILLWANMTHSQASGFAFSIWQKIPSAKIYVLDTKNSMMYWFYPENFDFDSMSWKTSKDYLINKPLERLNKK
ncbi:MAG: winged helix-turn-helix transcriptional regulator [Candidatus Heimdallarchaeota archaeon]